MIAVATAHVWGELSVWLESLYGGFDIGQYIVAAIDFLQGRIILEFTSSFVCNYVHLDGLG